MSAEIALAERVIELGLHRLAVVSLEDFQTDPSILWEDDPDADNRNLPPRTRFI